MAVRKFSQRCEKDDTKMQNKYLNIIKLFWKLPLCAIAFYGGTMAGGMVAAGIGLPAPEMPAGAGQRILGQ